MIENTNLKKTNIIKKINKYAESLVAVERERERETESIY